MSYTWKYEVVQDSLDSSLDYIQNASRAAYVQDSLRLRLTVVVVEVVVVHLSNNCLLTGKRDVCLSVSRSKQQGATTVSAYCRHACTYNTLMQTAASKVANQHVYPSSWNPWRWAWRFSEELKSRSSMICSCSPAAAAAATAATNKNPAAVVVVIAIIVCVCVCVGERGAPAPDCAVRAGATNHRFLCCCVYQYHPVTNCRSLQEAVRLSACTRRMVICILDGYDDDDERYHRSSRTEMYHTILYLHAQYVIRSCHIRYTVDP